MQTAEYQNYPTNPSSTNCGSDLIFITMCIFMSEDKTTGLCMGWNIPWKILKSGTNSGNSSGLVPPQEEDTDPLTKLGHMKHCLYELVIYFVCISLAHVGFWSLAVPHRRVPGNGQHWQMCNEVILLLHFSLCPVTAGIVLHTQNSSVLFRNLPSLKI